MADSTRFWHHSCHNAFVVLGRALDKHTEYEKDFPQDTFIDFFGRFNVWADNIGAGRQGRTSLDYRLRDATEIKDYVVLALRHLLKALENGES